MRLWVFFLGGRAGFDNGLSFGFEAVAVGLSFGLEGEGLFWESMVAPGMFARRPTLLFPQVKDPQKLFFVWWLPHSPKRFSEANSRHMGNWVYLGSHISKSTADRLPPLCGACSIAAWLLFNLTYNPLAFGESCSPFSHQRVFDHLNLVWANL